MSTEQRTGVGDGKSLAQGEARAPLTQLERDELQAHLTDAYLEQHDAERDLRIAATLIAERGNYGTGRLVTAARRYGAVCRRIDEIKQGVSVEVLYGDLVIGHALQLADVIRNQRREREEALAETQP